jgi:hypothetical protein
MRPFAKQENIREGARRHLSLRYLPRRAQTGAHTDCYRASDPDPGRDCDRSPKIADKTAWLGPVEGPENVRRHLPKSDECLKSNLASVFCAAGRQRREEKAGSLTHSQLPLAEQLTGYFNCLRLHSIGDSIHMETCKLRSYPICNLAKNKHRYMRSNRTAKARPHSYKPSRI